MPLTLDARVRALGRQLAVVAAALALVTCTDNPTGPSIGGTVHLAVSPRFKSNVVLSPALPIDEARLIVYRQLDCDCSPDSVAGATAPFALDQDSIRMQLSFRLEQTPETLEVQFELLGQGQPLFIGDTTVIIRAGVAAQVPPVTVYYEGPGSDIHYLSILPQDTVLTFGDSLQFTAQGSNSFEQPETAFYLSWSSSLAAAKIRSDGLIKAPSQRATATIRAQAPNGVTDSTTISFVPKPVSLAKVSGDTQTATVNSVLPLPLRVRVKAADSLGVAGVRLVFHPVGFAGPVGPDTVYTDSLGFAEATATLSDSTGTQQWQVTGTGLTAVTFSATAQIVAGPPARLHVVTQPADTQVNGAIVIPSPVIQVEDSAGIPVHKSGLGVYAQTYSWLTGAPKTTRTLPKGIKPAGKTGPYRSAYVFGVADDTTDAQGRVTFTGLRLTGYGTERIIFNSDSLSLLADTSLTLFVKEGAPKLLFKASGDSSSSYVDSLVSVLPAVYVYDSTYNPVPHAAAVFQVTAGGGQLPHPVDTVFTDSTGYAQLPSWRLGATPGTNAVQATVAGAGSLIFTAFAQPPVPTVLLQLQGTSVVGVGRTAVLQIKLSSPAGAGGDSLAVTSSNPSVITAQPAGLFVPSGDSIAYDTLTGVAAGTDTISVAAAGYITGVLPVTASLNLISLPTTLTVPYGGTSNISITLGAPAPAGGVVVTLSSSDSTKVGVQTPTVSFAQGDQTKNGILTGVALGTATVTASNPNYAGDQATVTTAANLNIVATSSTIYPAFPDTQTIQFLSQGVAIAAPAGGIAVTLTPADSSCVSVPAAALIPAGLSSVQFTASYAGVAATPCTSKVFATAAGVGPDSVSITVGNPPAISAGTLDLGASLQQSVSVGLGAVTTAPLTLTVRPLTPGIVRFAPNLSTVGVDTFTTTVPSGTSYLTVVAAGVDSVINDSTYVEISLTGFKTDTALVRVRQAGLQLAGVPTNTTSFSATAAIYAYFGVPYTGNTNIQNFQGLRAGHAPVTVTFHVAPGAYAQLTDSSGTFDTVRTAQFVTSASSIYYTPTSLASGGVGFHPMAAGSTTTSVTAPGYVSLPASSTGTTISAPTISTGVMQVGAGLQINNQYVSLGAAPPTASTATIRSLNPAVAIVSDSQTKAGADSVQVPISTSTSYFYFFVQGVDGVLNDSTRIAITIPGYSPDTAWVYVRQPAMYLGGVPSTTTTFTPKSSIYAYIGVPYSNYSGIYQYQPLRAGASPLTVTFHTTAPAVGVLTDSTGATDTVRTAVIAANGSVYYTPTSVASGGVGYQPVGPGSSKTWASIPGYYALAADTQLTTVSAPALNLSGATVGSGLQTAASVSLGATTPAPDTLVLVSLNPSAIRLAANDSTPGTDSLMIPVGTGTSYVTYYVQGIEGVSSDSAMVTATMTGYAFNQVRQYVRQAGVELSNVLTTTTTLSDSNAVWAQVGLPYVGNSGMQQYQAVRAGAAPATFVFKVSNPSVQRFATQSGPADSVVVTVPPRSYFSAQSVSNGGQALKVLTTGNDTVRAAGAGFVSLPLATRSVTVSAPGISVQQTTVGGGLVTGTYATLGASQHGTDTVVVKSSNPSVLLVSPNSTTPGSDSILVPMLNGQTYVSFVVIGVPGQTGTPIVTVSAPGFTDGTAPIGVVQPAAQIYNLSTTQTAGGADDPIYVLTGVPYAGNSGINTSEQVAPGYGPLTVTFTTSDSTASTLVTQSATAGTATATIQPGLYYSPTSVASGGVAFRPLATGSPLVHATIPGFIEIPVGGVTVNVSP